MGTQKKRYFSQLEYQKTEYPYDMAIAEEMENIKERIQESEQRITLLKNELQEDKGQTN